MSMLDKVTGAFIKLGVLVWDNGLFVLNLFLPKYDPQHVVPEGAPGHNGKWPPYVAPKPGDSRSACPMLNALANHGILPHDGKNISFPELNATVRSSFNFAPSFCFFVPKFAADFLERSYWNDKFNLEELNLRADNAIEHDASLTRHDVALQPDQSKPDLKLVDELLREASSKDVNGSPRLTKQDLSRQLAKRRVDAAKTNKTYAETFFHNMFGSANSSTMLTIFGGRVDDLRPMLTDERFSDNWQPRILDRYGLTMAAFNSTVIPVEWQTKHNIKKLA